MINNTQTQSQSVQRPLLTDKQTGLLCVSVLSEDTVNSLEELGGILKRIHKRMIFEGYEIRDGKVCKNVYE